MKKIWMSTALMALMTASCTNEEIINQPFEGEGVPFTLSAEHGMASRTTLSGQQTLWSEGDQIYVSSADGSVYGVLTLKNGANSNSAEFFGYISGDASKLAYTIFPAPKSGNKIDLSKRDASNGELDAPMIATFDPTNKNSVNFKNETALVKLPISGLAASTKPTVKLSGMKIGGNLVPYNNNGTWELVYDGTPVGAIEISNVENGDLLIPVATTLNEKSNVDNTPAIETVELFVTIGNDSEKSIGDIDIMQGEISENKVPKIEVDENGEVEVGAVVTTEVQLQNALTAKTKNIKLGADFTATNIITISSNVVLDGNGHTLTSTAPRAINIETTDAVTINNLNIVAKDRAINIINKPSTVNLNDVTATADIYAVMIATSAGAVRLTVENCDFTGLAVVNIAGAGTTADIIDTKITNVDATDKESYGAITLWKSAAEASVIVSGGVITVADDSRKAYVFPGDASVTGVDDIGYIVATIGDAGYETLNEAVEDVTEAGTIVLIRDINVSKAVLVEQDCTINMNGKTLSLEQPISVLGTLNLSNGTISSEGEIMVLGEKGRVEIADNVVLNSGDGKGRIKNQGGQGKISANALGKFIVYHEIETGTFESFMSLNADKAYENINTLVLKGTFFVNNTVIAEKCTAYGVDPSSYFLSTGNEFGGHVKRIEFTEGSSLDVSNNVGDTTGRTSIGFEDICILGDASIIGNEDNESVIYFDRGTKITISEGKTLSLKNKLRLATGNNPADSEKGNALVTGQGTLKIVGNNVRINDKQNDPNAIILNVVVE